MFGLFGLAFGNLNNGVGNSGLSCLNGNNGLSVAIWNFLARQSGIIYLHCMAAAENSSRRQLPSHPAGKIDNKNTGAGRKRTPLIVPERLLQHEKKL